MKQTTTNTTTATFADTLHAFAAAYASGDYAAELTALSNAIAHAVLNKCLDPQRKTAAERQTVSNSGINPAMRSLKIGLTADGHLLENTRHAVNAATYSHLNADGEMVTETVDHDALDAAAVLCAETLSDGIDLAQEIAVALLEQAQAHATADPEWMETPYTVNRLSRRVLIKEQTAAWKEETTTPIQEVYRAARRYIQNSRAAQTDPRNGYSYIEDFATDEQGGMEVIYHRLQKWADLGGMDRDEHYTADTQTAVDYYAIFERLHLNEKQTRIVELRMRGYGHKAIATACGISVENAKITVRRIREKCSALGFTPYAYKTIHADEMTPAEIRRFDSLFD